MRKLIAIILAAMTALAMCACSSNPQPSESSDEGNSAEAIQAKADLDVGIGYWMGTGEGGYDLTLAKENFKKAADGGNADAYYWLGLALQKGTEADRWAEVVGYYQKAADNNSAIGWYGLGELYESGYGFKQDFAKANEYYQNAIDDGCDLGYVGLGDLYATGHGVPADGTKAIEYYEKAIASDDWISRNTARVHLARLYMRADAEKVSQNGQKALEYLIAASEENFHEADYAISYMYINAAGINQDFVKGCEYAQKACDGGYYYNLGLCYAKGYGVPVDAVKAVELYRSDIDGGKEAALAMAGLAYQYTTGEGVGKDLKTALAWTNNSVAALGPGDTETENWDSHMMSWLAEQGIR